MKSSDKPKPEEGRLVTDKDMYACQGEYLQEDEPWMDGWGSSNIRMVQLAKDQEHEQDVVRQIFEEITRWVSVRVLAQSCGPTIFPRHEWGQFTQVLELKYLGKEKAK